MTTHLDRRCPHCGRLNELHTGTDDDARAPKPGDLSVCWQCLSPAIFTALALRPLTPAEMAGEAGEAWARMVAAALAHKAKR